MIAGRDVYATTALYGLTLFFAALVVITVAILIEDPASIYFLLFFAVPALVAGAAILLLRRWGLLVGAIIGVIGVIALLEDVDVMLSTPDAFFDFVATLTGLIGAAIVAISSLTGTVQYFRKQVAEGPGAVPLYLKALAPVLLVIALISGVLTALQTGNVSAEDARGAISITAKKTEWNVQTVDAPAGETIRLLLRNNDPLLHTFTIHDLDIDVTLGPWSERIIEISPPRAGIYGFICRLFDHETDMTGAIVVE